MLDFEVAQVTPAEAAALLLKLATTPQTKAQLVVTLNPEITVQAEQQPELKEALLHARLTVADGVGVVWAAKQLGNPLPARVSGVDLMTDALRLGGKDLRVYFLGGKPGVAKRAAEVAQERFQTTIAGSAHGYFDKATDAARVVAQIKESGAQLLLAGLGEGQELFLHRHRQALGVNAMMGIGGALDVLSGEVKRAPAWTHKLGVEWAYRVGLDRKRWHRFPRLLRFVQLVKQRR